MSVLFSSPESAHGASHQKWPLTVQSCLSSSTTSLLGNSNWINSHAPETSGTSTSFGLYTQTAGTIHPTHVPTRSHMPSSPGQCERQTVAMAWDTNVVLLYTHAQPKSPRNLVAYSTPLNCANHNEFDFDFGTHHYQRISVSSRQKLKPQYQSSTVPTTAPTPVFSSLIPVSSVFTNQQQGESTQDARTVLSSVRSWSDRRNSSPTPSLDNTVPSFMRDTMITRAAELMSDMQLFATADAPPQLRSGHDDSELARDPDREDTAEPTQRRDEPVDRWTVSSPATGHDHNASTYNEYNDDTSDRSYGRDIHFGLSPSALFERANNQGSYREFEHSNDNGTQRDLHSSLTAIKTTISAAPRQATAITATITRLTATATDFHPSQIVAS